MKNTNTNEYKEKVKAYLLPIINEKAADYGEKPEHPFAWSIETAKNEVPHEFDRRGVHGGLSWWLSGLALDIAYTYTDIIEQAEDWHSCQLTDKQKGIVCEKWFDHIAAKIMQFD